MAKKIDAQAQLAVDGFAGFDPTTWPDTTIPALALRGGPPPDRLASQSSVREPALRAAAVRRGRNVMRPGRAGEHRGRSWDHQRGRRPDRAGQRRLR
ncbi:MAG: hypothetical protein R2695_13090 [Acidimicrobiales bacterium]